MLIGNLILGAVAVLAIVTTLVSMAALLWVTRRRRHLPDFTPPVTIFKPLKGIPQAALEGPSVPGWGRQRVRSASAAFTAGLACSAPSTEIEAMAARASSGVTSGAMLARPSTRMSSGRPAVRAASSSSRP